MSYNYLSTFCSYIKANPGHNQRLFSDQSGNLHSISETCQLQSTMAQQSQCYSPKQCHIDCSQRYCELVFWYLNFVQGKRSQCGNRFKRLWSRRGIGESPWVSELTGFTEKKKKNFRHWFLASNLFEFLNTFNNASVANFQRYIAYEVKLGSQIRNLRTSYNPGQYATLSSSSSSFGSLLSLLF